MKTNIKSHYKLLICAILGYLSFSCDVSQDWSVDSSLDGLFRPLSFQTSNVLDTAATLSFNRVIGASKYILEVSEGDTALAFNNITKRIEITTDTFHAYATNTTATKTEYRKSISGLLGETTYSARLMAVNADSSLKTQYTTIKFTTQAEQLFKAGAVVRGTDSIALKWNITNRVTSIVMHPTAATDNSQDVVRTLTPQEIASGATVFKGLAMGTEYKFTIYYNSVKRGQLTLRTLGLANSVTYEVQPTDNAASIITAINSFIANNNRIINISFKAGQTYTITGLTLPDGIEQIKFSGEPDVNGNLPAVTLNNINLGSTTASLSEATFENLDINGNAVNYCVSVTNPSTTLKTIGFNSCKIKNFNRAVISVSNVALSINNISITNSIISKIGGTSASGYGIVNIAGTTNQVANVTLQYCTMYDITTHFIDFRCAAKFNMLNCTVYNSYTAGYTLVRFLRTGTAPLPAAVNFQKCIFAGGNNGIASLIGFSYNSSSNTVLTPLTSFAGSYSSSDFPLQYASTASTAYPNLQVLTLSSTQLFSDPANGDFSIKTGATFDGKDVAGDPRWFTK